MLIEDLRQIWRRWRRSPGFAWTIVLILAVGIAGSVIAFSLADAILIRPLPYPEQQRLVNLYEQNRDLNIPEMLISLDSYRFLEREASSIGRLAVFHASRPLALGTTEGSARLRASFVSEGYFEILGVEAELGRLFSSAEHGGPMVAPVAVVSHALWRGRFGGDESALGRSLLLNDLPVTLIGVLPARFDDLSSGGLATEVWLPLEMSPLVGYPWEIVERRTTRWLGAVARLAPGATMRSAQAELDELAAHLREAYPASHSGYRFVLRPLRDMFVGSFRPALLALAGGAAFLLLIGCANASNLLLVRAVARRRDVALQLALGIGWRRLFLQRLMEGVAIASVAGGLGLLLAGLGRRLLLRFSPVSLPDFVDLGLGTSDLVMTAALTLLAALLFGAMPFLAALQVDPRELRDQSGRQGGSGGFGRHTRQVLVVVEVATALILLVGALLMIRSFQELSATDVGFDSDRLLALRTDLTSSRYAEEEARRLFVRLSKSELETVPGVEGAVVWSPDLPGQAVWYTTFAPEGRAVRTLEDAVVARYHKVTPGGLRILGIPLLLGRGIEGRDRAESTPVAVVSAATARALFGQQDPLGKRFYRNRGSAPSTQLPYTVVGVAADARLGGRAQPEVGTQDVYLSYDQEPEETLSILLRSGSDPAVLTGQVKEALAGIDARLPLFDFATMRERLAAEEQQARFSAYLIGCFALVALLLSALGLYSVLSYVVRRRTREVGVRMALGGGPLDIARQLGLQIGRLVAMGLLVGLIAMALLSRLLGGLLYGVDPLDPTSYAAAILVLAAVALVSTLAPLRRAAGVDPVVALRSE